MRLLCTGICLLLALGSFEALAEPAGDRLQSGASHYRKGQWARAERDLLLALEADPASAEAHAILGRICLMRHHAADAVAHFEAALRLGSTDPEVFVGLASAYRSADDLDGAIEAGLRYVAAHPERPEPYLTLGGLYDANGRRAEAEEAFAAYRIRKRERTPME
jgi:cytochrome c-type biogenesis protein CcmH/NrfG